MYAHYLIRLTAITLAVALIAPALMGHSRAEAQEPPDTIVTQWNETLMQGTFGPLEGLTYSALLHLAIYDAVVTVQGGYEPFAHNGPHDPNASAEAAAAAAGHGIITHFLPASVEAADALYATQLAAIADGPAKTDGIAIGQAAAQAVLALPLSSQILANTDYITPDPLLPGVWSPTAPPPTLAFGYWMTDATPLTFADRAQFRPAGPPALDSPEWVAQYNEVMTLGGSTSTERTEDQTAAALYFGEHPTLQSQASLRNFVIERELDLLDASRYLAMTNTGLVDGLIACFEAKYHFQLWRPIQAIRGDDGNPDTLTDAAWETLLPGTPNHPEYPSAHSCATPAWALLTEHFLGTSEINFTGVTVVEGRANRFYPTTESLIAEVGDGRVWGGIHFRQAVVDGTAMARQIAANIADNYFQPLPQTADPTPTPMPTPTPVSAPMPPDTGSGLRGGEADGASPVAMGAAAALLATALLVAGVAARRRARSAE